MTVFDLIVLYLFDIARVEKERKVCPLVVVVLLYHSYTSAVKSVF